MQGDSRENRAPASSPRDGSGGVKTAAAASPPSPPTPSPPSALVGGQRPQAAGGGGASFSRGGLAPRSHLELRTEEGARGSDAVLGSGECGSLLGRARSKVALDAVRRRWLHPARRRARGPDLASAGRRGSAAGAVGAGLGAGSCLRRSLAAFLARDGGAAVCVLGCFAPDLGQGVAAPASGSEGAAWRSDPAEEEDAGAAAPGVRAFSSLLRRERVWRESTRREVLRCGLPQWWWWWWWVAACCRVCSATASLADRRRRLWVR
jgi:hypothetical protein